MKHLPLTNSNLLISCDDMDYEILSKFTWWLHNGRAHTQVRRGKRRVFLQPAEIVMGLSIHNRRKRLIDHKDQNPLNNSMSNLRFATSKQNSGNRSVRSGEHKGVKLDKKSGKYAVRVASKYQGSYENADEAALVYNVYALRRWKEFAYLNCVVIK